MSTVALANDTAPCTRTHVTLKRGRLHAALKAVRAFTSGDPTRSNLAAILIELTPGAIQSLRLVATDGHALAYADVLTTSVAAVGPRTFLAKAADVKTMIKTLACKRANENEEVSLSLGTTATLTVATHLYSFVSAHGPFPDYAQVIPARTSEGVPRINASPVYIARACDAVATFGRDKKSQNPVAIQCGTDVLSPMRLDFSDPELGEFCAVIMPMRIR